MRRRLFLCGSGFGLQSRLFGKRTDRRMLSLLSRVIQVADGLESMRCHFQRCVDIGGTMRRGQEHVVPG